MTAPAQLHYRTQQRLSRAAAGQVQQLWTSAAGDSDIRAAFDALLPRMVATITAAQLLAASHADDYTSTLLGADDRQLAGPVDPAMLAGVASDGRSLEGLLTGGLAAFFDGLDAGLTRDEAVTRGAHRLVMATATQVADAGRAADGIAVISHGASGYYRHLTLPSCGRCAILAGRHYRWNGQFRRHPECDCTYRPAARDDTGSTLNVRAYFDGLTQAQQAQYFGAAAAQAIRDGADPAQVVNAARGTTTATYPGTTTEGTTRRGWYAFVQRALDRETQFRRGAPAGASGVRYFRTRRPRLMPEQIYATARTRDEAIRLLMANGYFLDSRATSGPHPLARIAAELLAA